MSDEQNIPQTQPEEEVEGHAFLNSGKPTEGKFWKATEKKSADARSDDDEDDVEGHAMPRPGKMTEDKMTEDKMVED